MFHVSFLAPVSSYTIHRIWCPSSQMIRDTECEKMNQLSFKLKSWLARVIRNLIWTWGNISELRFLKIN